MNDYINVKVQITPYSETVSDILSALLADIGFESFVQTATGLDAYIQTSLFNKEKLESVIENFPFNATISYVIESIKGKNWNEEWEKNYFQPIVIDNECVIYSTHHKNIPQAKYSIIIDPKMAVGTGHHETTSLILTSILKGNVSGKKVLDMGCGTAVLAILAAKRGADKITAIDIDPFAYENAVENIALNNVSDISVKLGGVELLGNETYDIIYANINRNILLNDMHVYVRCMHSGSEIYFSGFYVDDIPVIKEEAEKCDLKFENYIEKNKWVATKFIKR